LREKDYFSQMRTFYRPIRSMVWITTLLIALGAVLGGLNTMYATFAARVRELGALQSLGFSRSAITLNLVQESVLAVVAGALPAAATALWLLDGAAIRFSMGVFGLKVDAIVLAIGLGAGLLLGIVGALPPAWRCLRPSIAEALKTA
jgi:putative ABC transport system permease protein